MMNSDEMLTQEVDAARQLRERDAAMAALGEQLAAGEITAEAYAAAHREYRRWRRRLAIHVRARDNEVTELVTVLRRCVAELADLAEQVGVEPSSLFDAEQVLERYPSVIGGYSLTGY